MKLKYKRAYRVMLNVDNPTSDSCAQWKRKRKFELTYYLWLMHNIVKDYWICDSYYFNIDKNVQVGHWRDQCVGNIYLYLAIHLQSTMTVRDAQRYNSLSIISSISQFHGNSRLIICHPCWTIIFPYLAYANLLLFTGAIRMTKNVQRRPFRRWPQKPSVAWSVH